MATTRVSLKYPEGLIKEPLLFRMAQQFEVMPNIRRARVTETVGEVTLELEGTPENIAAGLRYLEDAGVQVEPVVGDLVE
jgi:L-aspartate semialdehyde sulfurtransferase ferredoxin